jgi:hypothetical protein
VVGRLESHKTGARVFARDVVLTVENAIDYYFIETWGLIAAISHFVFGI